jgi:hypothetical protein
VGRKDHRRRDRQRHQRKQGIRPAPEAAPLPAVESKPDHRTVKERYRDLLAQTEVGGQEIKGGRSVADLIAEVGVRKALEGDHRFFSTAINCLEAMGEPSAPVGEESDEPGPAFTSEIRLEQRALANGWVQDQGTRERIFERLAGIVLNPRSKPRDVNSAGKTLIQADIAQQRIEFARTEQGQKAAGTAAVATVAADPIDPARFDWYGESCPCGLPLGECKKHPRARASQRPPEGEWNKWFMMGGRGSGKTMAGAEWIRHVVEGGQAKRIALVAPTAADVRDVMIEGESGILAISRPDFMPVYQPSIRRITWPNGTVATTYSADEPERLRGPQHDHAWIDEPGAWRYGQQAYDMLMFGLRLGDCPQLLATSTPRPTKLIKGLLADGKVVVTRCTTYENRTQLAEAFFSEIIAKYEGTRLGEQEINAQLIDVAEGAWFPMFSVARHRSVSAEYDSGHPIRVAIDAGTSRHTGAVLFQLRPRPHGWPLLTIFGDYHAVDVVSADNAAAIRRRCIELTQRAPDIVRLDPAATARTSIGPAAYNEYSRVFGDRITGRWPQHGVADGLDQIELMLSVAPREPSLLIHPRCLDLIQAFQNYRRVERAGEFLDEPVDPQHPHEDLMDALRGGIRDAMPGGRVVPPDLRSVHVSGLY